MKDNDSEFQDDLGSEYDLKNLRVKRLGLLIYQPSRLSVDRPFTLRLKFNP